MGNHGSQGILYAFLYFQSFGRHIQIDGRGQQIPHFHFHLFFGMTVFVVHPQRNKDLPDSSHVYFRVGSVEISFPSMVQANKAWSAYR